MGVDGALVGGYVQRLLRLALNGILGLITSATLGALILQFAFKLIFKSK